MKDNRTENLQATAISAEAEDKEEKQEIAAGLKKFKDVQALIDAYTALEAEFTRRSQLLKELGANKETGAPAKAENAQTPSPAVAEDAGSGVRPLTQEEKNAVIEEYLNGVCANRSVPFITVGGAVRAARVAPKTLSEAGTLAKHFFENKEN